MTLNIRHRSGAQQNREVCTAMTTVAFGSNASSDGYPPLVVTEGLIHQVSSNDEVERRGASPASNEGNLSQSSTPSLAQRRCDPAIARTDC